MIVWAGVPSDHVGVVVEHYPDQPGPARQYETISVPGRNGDLIIDRGSYSNYTQSYDIYFSAEHSRLYRGAPMGARAVRAWLLGPVGYQVLEDSYDPDFYRTAYYVGPPDVENIMNRFGRLTISFNCKPQRWRKDGRRSVTLTAPGTLYNDLFPAKPLIRVNGTAAGTLTVGAYTVAINELADYIMLDSDLQDAYRGTQNENAAIATDAFPVLEHGDNAISWTGGITSVEITPKWWTI